MVLFAALRIYESFFMWFWALGPFGFGVAGQGWACLFICMWIFLEGDVRSVFALGFWR